MNGREVTADDVVYSLERFRTVKGNANAYMLDAVAKVEAPDRATVRVTLKEPFAWFLDMLAFPGAVVIVARECVEKFGDLKKPEAVVGTGPWMLDSYRPNVGLTMVRNPQYFLPGLPYIDRVELVVDEDNASRVSAFLAGKYDLGWETPGIINRTDWVQIKNTLKQRRPNLLSAILQRRPRAPGHRARREPPGRDRGRAGGHGRPEPAAARVPEGLGAAGGPARRGRPVLSARPGGGPAPPGRGRLPAGATGPPRSRTSCSSC